MFKTKTIFDGSAGLIRIRNIQSVPCVMINPRCRGRFIPSRANQKRCLLCEQSAIKVIQSKRI